MLSDLPRKFLRSAELFGNFGKGHEVDRSGPFGCLSKNFQKICSPRSSLKLPVTWFQRDILDVCKTAEMYVMSNLLVRDHESRFV